jgi:DNA-binding CsgD family transcriptional regulator
MMHEPSLVSIHRISAFRLDPSLTSEEAIVLRALAAGQTDGQVCNELQINLLRFRLVMRKIREKIGAADNISLISWAKRRIKGADRRINGQKDMHAPRESERLPKNEVAGAGQRL